MTMTNKIIVNTLPVILSNKQENNPTWQLRQKIAKQDLEVAQKSILRDIQQNIAIEFADEIILTLSINMRTFKIKIDYSQIKSKTATRLIKLYLSRDI